MQNNVDKLRRLLKTRLASNIISTSRDFNGNIINYDGNVFSENTLNDFLELSLSMFNQIPNFTDFTLENTAFVNIFTEILVEGATLYALGSRALIEKGREFQIVDGGISFTAPALSELLNTQYQTLLHNHYNKLKLIKNNFLSLALDLTKLKK